MKIAVLTSSRADYSIYLPLLKALQAEEYCELHIIAFGTHVKEQYGHTVDRIKEDGFQHIHKLDTFELNDSPEGIGTAMGQTTASFARFYAQHQMDLIFCLGDRFEMFAAVSASVPFNIPVAHLHGGEETKGAIDNKFRHAISLMSTYHFASTEQYRQRIEQLTGSAENTFNVGALSFDNLSSLPLLSVADFKQQFNIDLLRPTILITFHPETVAPENNTKYAEELVATFTALSGYQLVITMPNADTMGNVIRDKFMEAASKHKHIVTVESLGTIGYLSCMKHCSFMLGNTSSGFIEASYFPKVVINLGSRQDGRICTPNILNCPIEKEEMLATVDKAENMPPLEKPEIYGNGTAATKILGLLRTFPEYQKRESK